jgi:hypothetical protein
LEITEGDNEGQPYAAADAVSLTEDQIHFGAEIVTHRDKWLMLKPGGRALSPGSEISRGEWRHLDARLPVGYLT